MKDTLNICVDNHYRVLSLRGKQIRSLIAPVVDRYTSVIDFNPDAGVVVVRYEATLTDGEKVVDDDFIDLNDELWFGFSNIKDTIRSIGNITLNQERFCYDA